MVSIELNNKHYDIPQEWNELNYQQLLQIMETLFLKKYTADEGLLKLLKTLCNMSYFDFFNTPVTTCVKRVGILGKKVEVTGMDEYLYLTGFIFDNEIKLTKQLMPQYDNLYGPADECSNLIMQEMVFTEDYFTRWKEDQEQIDLLDNLCATLYRPLRVNKDGSEYDININPEGDCREEFNMNKCNHLAEHKIKNWPMKAKLAIATFYDGFRTTLVENNPEVFGGEGGEPAQYGLISTMLRVAKEGVLGDFEKVEKQYVNLVMIQLNESIAEAKAIEKQMKQTA